MSNDSATRGHGAPQTADAAPPLDGGQQEAIREIVARHRHRRGPLIEVLHDVQAQFGCVPRSSVPLIATELNLSRADVHGVLTFYHYFRESPPGRRTVRICRAESCQAMNGAALEAHARHSLGIGPGETTADGRVTLEAAYCLGLCAMSPAVMVDGEVHGHVTPERLDELLAARTAGAKS